jgi:Protein of unknown function (DUF3040)
MSLSAHEQQALDDIAARLAGSDPRLATRLAMFTRLTSGEDMPNREMVARTRRDYSRPRRSGRRLGLPRATALLWLLISLTLIAVALAASDRGNTCSKSWPATCAKPGVLAFVPPPAG